jgi:hypothetical protein
VEQGDKVAVIGYGFGSFWARLARVQIVAEMLGWQADDFWLGDPALQSEVVQAFAGTGARAIVAEKVPSYATLRLVGTELETPTITFTFGGIGMDAYQPRALDNRT